MATCSTCGGDGFQTSLDEDERSHGINDSCYHCATTGICEEPGCCDDEKAVQKKNDIDALWMRIARLDELYDRDALDEGEAERYYALKKEYKALTEGESDANET